MNADETQMQNWNESGKTGKQEKKNQTALQHFEKLFLI